MALSIVLHLFFQWLSSDSAPYKLVTPASPFHPFLVHILDKGSAGYLYGQLPYMVLRPARLKSTITVVMPRQTEVLPQMGEEGIYPEIESKKKQHTLSSCINLQHQNQTKGIFLLSHQCNHYTCDFVRRKRRV